MEELSARMASYEERQVGPNWLDMINSRFLALEERMTRESERIAVIEINYRSIESSLDAILKSIDRVHPTTEDQPDPFIATA